MNSAVASGTIRKPVIHHLNELRRRLTWSVLAVIVGATLAYNVNTWLLEVIQKPLGKTLYYTSPMGGFNFLLKLCLVVGFVLALPVILYHVFAFLGPLLTRRNRLTISAYTLWSFILACSGILFAYFISLPSALTFLSQFGGSTIQSLITVDEYFNFALAYLAGFALMFQVPLIILFINRIKPLKPSKMMRAQRYIILFSFIAAAILTPTPDPFNQTIMALPAILLYQIGIILVWLMNRSKTHATSAPSRVENTHKETAPAKRVVAPVRPHNVMAVPGTINSTGPRNTQRRSVDGFIARSVRVPARQSVVITNARRPAPQRSSDQVKPSFDIVTT